MSPSVRTIENWLIGICFVALAVMLIVIAFTVGAFAQGIYMGRDGRAHAQVIVGADGGVFPVIPTYCQQGWGPCPVVLAPPLPWRYAPPPPLAYGPPPPPAPIGWIWGRGAPCADPDCHTLVIQVAVDGLNVRATPGGPAIAALANGVPVTPLTKAGDWMLVAPACSLAPTFTASVTAGGIPLSVCGL